MVCREELVGDVTIGHWPGDRQSTTAVEVRRAKIGTGAMSQSENNSREMGTPAERWELQRNGNIFGEMEDL